MHKGEGKHRNLHVYIRDKVTVIIVIKTGLITFMRIFSLSKCQFFSYNHRANVHRETDS